MRNALLCALALLLAGCVAKPIPPPVITPDVGPKTRSEIEELKTQIEALKQSNVDQGILIGKVAGSSYGIDVGLGHLELPSKGKDIVTAENSLIKDAVGEPPPIEKAAAAARTIAIVQGDLAQQKALYGEAKTQIDTHKQEIAQKQALINARDLKIDELSKQAAEEVEANRVKIDQTVKLYEGRLKAQADAAASKERAMWVNVLRFGGFGVILAGVAALALTSGRALMSGLILIGSGSLIIFIGVAINVVISQPWFPYAAAGVGLLTLGAIGVVAYNVYTRMTIGMKATRTLNDIKTEAETLVENGNASGAQILSKIEPHVNYRFGEPTAFWNRSLKGLYAKEGLDAKR